MVASSTKIEWTDKVWNPVAGCSPVSTGCNSCYAARLAATRLKHHPKYEGLAKIKDGRPVWSSEVRTFSDDTLTAPLRWKKSRMVFVNSMSDLFHPQVPDEFIHKVFAVMIKCPQHTFQVLTKRPKRIPKTLGLRGCGFYAVEGPVPCPFPNVWLGTSIEDQATADERIPELLKCPAAVRFVSCEPLLGPVELPFTDLYPHLKIKWLDGTWGTCRMLHWVIVGGETGPGARPMDPDWARSIRDQCKAADVPFFFKKMSGGKSTPPDLAIREYPLQQSEATPKIQPAEEAGCDKGVTESDEKTRTL